MKNKTETCWKCGKPIAIITWGIYRKSVVEPTAVMVSAEEGGETFVRVDGSKLIGREVGFDSGEICEPAYRPHHCRNRRKR